MNNYIINPITNQKFILQSPQGKQLLKNYIMVYKFHQTQKGGGNALFKLGDETNEYIQKDVVKNEKPNCPNCKYALTKDKPLDCPSCLQQIVNNDKEPKPFQKIRDFTKDLFKPSLEIQQNDTALNYSPNPNPNQPINDYRKAKPIKAIAEIKKEVISKF